MIMKKGISAAVGGATLLMLSHGPAFAVQSTCSAKIDPIVNGLVHDISVGLATCEKAWQTDFSKKVPDFSKAGPACDKQLKKVYGLGNGSKMDVAFGKLNKLVTPKTCTDADLQQLGHLPTTPFGDRWSRYLVLSALQHAIDAEENGARNFLAHLKDMSVGPFGKAPAGKDCTTCPTVFEPPCFDHSCVLKAPDSAADAESSTLAPHVPLVGVTTVTLCKKAGISPANEFLTTAAVSKGLAPADVSPAGHACVRGTAAEGFVSCALSSAPTVNYTTCVDHITTATGQDGGGCTETTCLPKSADCGDQGVGVINKDGTTNCSSSGSGAHPGVINGGACIGFTTGAHVDGGAFINNMTQLRLVLPGQEGTDGKVCTDDDTDNPAAPATTALTTGTAATKVLDQDNVSGVTAIAGPATGSPFDCSQIITSNLTNTHLVGAFPALHALLGGDSTTVFNLVCQ